MRQRGWCESITLKKLVQQEEEEEKIYKITIRPAMTISSLWGLKKHVRAWSPPIFFLLSLLFIKPVAA